MSEQKNPEDEQGPLGDPDGLGAPDAPPPLPGGRGGVNGPRGGSGKNGG